MSNPFFYGGPVRPHQFLNQRQALRRVVGRITPHGQSVAIVGEPRTGKTSLLEYLQAEENRAALYGPSGNNLIFSLLDVEMVGGEFTQAQFWAIALEPLVEKVIKPQPESTLAQQYRLCQENHFGSFTLMRLFRQLEQEKWCLVLLLDEFDMLLYHPTLNSAEFFGSLRALTSRSRGALAVVTASRQSLATLNTATQELNPTGSPYFNIFAEVNLRGFPFKDVTALLNRVSHHAFSAADRRYIVAVAGGQPYLLQLVASAMWEALDRGENDAFQRHLTVGQQVYQETRLHFADTWRVWSPAMRKAVTTVALAQIPFLLARRQFLTQNFLKELPDFAPEINHLVATGWLATNDNIPGGYRITQGALLWWLADELIRTMRDDKAFNTWLHDQHLVGLLTEKELEYFGKAVNFAGELLKQGAVTLVEAFAKGLVGN